MPSEHQSLLAEGLAELQKSAGLTFTYGSQTFVAWPSRSPSEKSGRLTSTPESTWSWATYTDLTTFPLGASGLTVTDPNGKKCTISRVEPKDPVTAVFRFTMHSPR